MKTCLFCGQELKSKWQKKFCNVSCQDRFQNPLRRKKIITIESICLKCGNKFQQNVKENGCNYIRRFCSRKCANSRILTNETKQKISESLQGKILSDVVREKISNSLKGKICLRVFAERIKRNCKLESCNKEIEISKLSKQKFCSQKCKNDYTHFLSVSQYIKRICSLESCNKEFECSPTSKRKFCSLKCASKNAGKFGGRKSSISQNRRSKNEIYFAELCNKNFLSVLTNEPMFNGWDADVILNDRKIAILWNGKWHYEKLKESHSVKQVQNRDKIKINEIIKAGYIPYIIKDMGSYNPVFVENEFKKFQSFIAG